MKPAVSVTVLFFLLVTAEGIRLQLASVSAIAHKLNEKNSLKKDSVVADKEGTVLHRSSDCSGRSRKLLAKTRSSSQILKTKLVAAEAMLRRNLSKAVETNEEDFSVKQTNAEHEQLSSEQYPDVVDIAGMDYSPARRKPPIHN